MGYISPPILIEVIPAVFAPVVVAEAVFVQGTFIAHIESIVLKIVPLEHIVITATTHLHPKAITQEVVLDIIDPGGPVGTYRYGVVFKEVVLQFGVADLLEQESVRSAAPVLPEAVAVHLDVL